MSLRGITDGATVIVVVSVNVVVNVGETVVIKVSVRVQGSVG